MKKHQINLKKTQYVKFNVEDNFEIETKDKGIDKLFTTKSSLTLNDVLSHQRYYKILADTSPKALITRQIVFSRMNIDNYLPIFKCFKYFYNFFSQR